MEREGYICCRGEWKMIKLSKLEEIKDIRKVWQMKRQILRRGFPKMKIL